MELKFHPFSDKNRFGYYSVGQYCTYSKVDAIETAEKMNLPVIWHFNDEVFDSLDWTTEPGQSLWDLYSIRAKQIREKYDYLVLFYSGGADSNNIFNSFVRNGIHLDEVVQWTNYEVTGDKTNNWNAEVFQVALPTTSRMIEENKLKTHHRIVDMSKILTNLDKIIPDLDDWIYGKNSYYSPNMRATSMVRQEVGAYKDLIDQGKSVCFIWGCEKPMLRYVVDPVNNNKIGVATVFMDRVDHCVSVKDQIENNSWIHDELFYWSPDLPELVVKQAHTVLNYANNISNREEKDNFINQLQTHQLPLLNQLIYPYWDPTTYSIGKNPSVVYSARDYWIMERDNDIKRKQIQAIKQTMKQVKSEWQDMRRGIKHFYSPMYTLTNVSNLDTKVLLNFNNSTTTNKYIRPRINTFINIGNAVSVTNSRTKL
jgi:hypothetical protein